MSETPKILLVDDLAENLLVLEAILADDDVELLEARSGTDALELLLAHEVALAIVDVHMPGMDGFELAELMRGSERTRSVPIIFVTAGPQDGRRVFEGYEAGGVDFLHKPLDPHVLRSKVGVFAELHRRREELASRLEELHRAQEALREADRRKDEFLAVLSHELRNPLAPIRTSLYLLDRTEPGGPRAKRAREIIGRQVDHLARLVDDLLDVTRINRGKIQLHLEDLDLLEVVRGTVDDYRPLYGAAKVDLQLEAPDEAFPVRGDPTRLSQLVGNLLGNAAKFTPEGGKVTLAVERDGTEAVLRVRDTGVGMEADFIEHVFEPFSQATRQLDRNPGGLGLGLVLVKRLAELHGGSARASSEGPGKGSELTVRLPMEAAAVPAERPEAAAANGGGAHRVLVIEDNPDTAESLCAVLEMMGHETDAAEDGPAGIARARTFHPDVILCDVGLPGMDGYEVARRLRADADLRHAVLVAMTGYALPEDRRRAEEAGFDHHLAKPSSIEAIEALLARIPAPRRAS